MDSDTGAPDADQTDELGDPSYRAAVVDLVGVLACAELAAFERLADDAKLAPTLDDRAELAAMAAAEFHHFTLLRDRLVRMGVAPAAAMLPFTEALTEFHERTPPADWLEGLIKAYVGDGIAMDFYREVGQHLDEETRQLVLEVSEDTGHAAFVVDRVRRAIADDPKVAGRLALWARRLVGEALSQAQRVAAEHEALSSLVVGGGPGAGYDLAEIGRLFARLTEAHTQRMAALGLSA